VKITVTLQDAPRLRAKLRKLPAVVAAEMPQIMSHAAERVAETARGLAPRRSGALRDSIVVARDPVTGQATVEARAPYAAFVEFGTVKRPARPFLGSALAASRSAIIEEISRALRRALGRP
jgi:HK97 gp10 family phage protein